MKKHETEREAERLEKKINESKDVYEYVEAKLDTLAAALDAAKKNQNMRFGRLARVLRHHQVLTAQNKIRQRSSWIPDHRNLSYREQRESITACYHAAIYDHPGLDRVRSIYSYR